jgi:hypothetical protein
VKWRIIVHIAINNYSTIEQESHSGVYADNAEPATALKRPIVFVALLEPSTGPFLLLSGYLLTVIIIKIVSCLVTVMSPA